MDAPKPTQCEPAAFWMQLEARLERIEARLDGDAEVVLALVHRLRIARLKLTSALHGARNPTTAVAANQ